MPEPASDPIDSRALMRAYLQRRRSGGALTAADFLQGRSGVDDALRAWLQVAEGWSELEIEERLTKLDDESAAARREPTVPIERTEAFERTLPIEPAEAEGAGERHFDGRYRVLDTLGEGGCGKVYLVEDMLHNHERLALKVVRTDLADMAQFEQRFRNEIRVLRALSHPRIPQIFNDGKTREGDIYYTMSYVPGTSLGEILDNEAPLAPERIVALVRQVIEVLEYAHAKGVVHRDLKPSNILVLHAGTAREEVRVLDFGIAKIMAREGALENAQTMQTVAMLGTPHYMSPEQVSGRTIDPSTDIYALGVIVYQMCSGKLPFTGKAMMELLTARLRTRPPQLSDESIPPWLRKLVSRLLELEGKKRPSTQEIQAIFTRGMDEGRKSAHKSVLVAGGALLLVAAGAYALFGGADDPPGEPEPPARLQPGTALEAAPGGREVAAEVAQATRETAAAAAGSGGPNHDPDSNQAAGDGTVPDADPEGQPAQGEPAESEPAAVAAVSPPPAPVLAGVELASPEAGLVTNAYELRVAGHCTPPGEFDLALGFAEEVQRFRARADGEGGFEQRISPPVADGRYTLVVEHDGRRVAQRPLRIDHTPPQPLEAPRLAESGPFAYEAGPVRALFRFDEPARLSTREGAACGHLASGAGEVSFPLPAVDSASPLRREVLLVVTDELGNAGEVRIAVEVFSSAVARLTESRAGELDAFELTGGAASFPPRVGFDLAQHRFLIPDDAGATRIFGLAQGQRLLGRVADAAPYLVFRVDSGVEETEMVLVCGASRPELAAEPFLIDRHEVTWERYEAFIRAAGGEAPGYKDFRPNLAGQVVVGVPWKDAEAFARWARKQLPGAAQWETAAGWNGAALRAFPWGDAFDPAAISVRTLDEAIRTSDLAADLSPWGVLGMGSGAREWITDLPATRSRRIARGGTSYAPVPFGFTLAEDYTQAPASYDSAYGVRTAEKTPKLLETPANLKDVGLRCIIPLEAR